MATENPTISSSPNTYFRGGKVILGSVILLLGTVAMLFVALSVLSKSTDSGAVKKAAKLIPAGKAVKAVKGAT